MFFGRANQICFNYLQDANFTIIVNINTIIINIIIRDFLLLLLFFIIELNIFYRSK